MSTQIVDNEVWLYVEEIINDESKLDKRLKEIKTKFNRPNLDLKPIEDQLAEVKREMRNCAIGMARATDDYTIDVLSEESEVLAMKRKELEKMRSELTNVEEIKSKVQAKLEEFRIKCTRKLPSLKGEPTFQDKREAIEILGICVTIYNRNHKPRYTIKMIPPEIVSLIS